LDFFGISQQGPQPGERRGQSPSNPCQVKREGQLRGIRIRGTFKTSTTNYAMGAVVTVSERLCIIKISDFFTILSFLT